MFSAINRTPRSFVNIFRVSLFSIISISFVTFSKSFSPASIAISSSLFFMTMSTMSSDMLNQIDPEYPGTAVTRLSNVVERVKSLKSNELNGDWQDVRRRLLWAGGLKDLPNAQPGYGYTGHSFNDFNHCDLTTMLGSHSNNENKGLVAGIAFRNHLGTGISMASIEELGEGGSWSTCMMGCNEDPPQDVAHIQFKSRIAFKLVWCPPEYNKFVIVDDSGRLLNYGRPTGNLPSLYERQKNYQLVKSSKYATAAELIGKDEAAGERLKRELI